MPVNMQGGEFSWYTDSDRNTFIDNGVLNLMATLTTDVIPDLTNCTIKVNQYVLSIVHHVKNVESYSVGFSSCTGSGPDCTHTCTADDPAPPVQSARIGTRGCFNFKYGRVEIRAQQPTGDWLWPAMWFMPASNAYGNWPFSGEIDLAESRGNADLQHNGVNIGNAQFASTLHFGTNRANDGWRTATDAKNVAPGDSLVQTFHVYGLEWTPGNTDYVHIMNKFEYIRDQQIICSSVWMVKSLAL